MDIKPGQLRGETYHARKGVLRHAFRYKLDYIICDLDAPGDLPGLFSLNARNLFSIAHKDHGGPPGDGVGTPWVRAQLRARLKRGSEH